MLDIPSMKSCSLWQVIVNISCTECICLWLLHCYPSVQIRSCSSSRMPRYIELHEMLCLQEALRVALRLGADPDASDSRGRPALALAVARGHTGALRALLAAGASAGLSDAVGQTPVSIAAGEQSRAEALEILLQHDPSLVDRKCGKSALAPLLLAAAASAAACVSALLRGGASPRARPVSACCWRMRAPWYSKRCLLSLCADPTCCAVLSAAR
jgi:Ankyrin repeats (3 copies)